MAFPKSDSVKSRGDIIREDYEDVGFREDINFAQILFWQLNRINQLACDPNISGERFYIAVSMMENLLPIDDNKEISKKRDEIQARFDGYLKNPNKKKIAYDLIFFHLGKELHKLVIEYMYSKNIALKRAIVEIIGGHDESDEDD